MGDDGDTLAENARRRAAIARTSRMLKHKLSLSLYKVERGYAHVPFQKLEAALDSTTGEVVGIPSVALDLTASTSSTASARQLPPNPANSAFARARSATMQTVASDASTSAAAVPAVASPSYTLYHASPAAAASSGIADSGASASIASQSSQQQQSQAIPPSHSALAYNVPPTPSSAPATTTAFPTPRNGSVEPKQKRQRRESATPRTQHSSGLQRAGTLTPTTASLGDRANDASQGHRRKPSQNTIWQRSRAILSGSDNGGLSLGGALTSPAKTNAISTIWEQPLQDGTGLGSQNTELLISPVRNTRYHPMNAYPQSVGGISSTPQARSLMNGQMAGGATVTPRHQVPNQQYNQVPHTIAHTGQSYIPYPSSNLSQFNEFLSPQNHYMHSQPQQPHMQNMEQQSAFYAMNGPQPVESFGMNPAQSAYMLAQNAAYPPAPSTSQTLRANYKVDPQQRSQSTISRTPSDLSFGQDGTLATLNSSQDSSSLDTELSMSQMPTGHMQQQLMPAQAPQMGGNTMARSASSATGTRPVTASGDNGESAAELMLFLAASPSPQQSSKRPPSTLGNDIAGMKGRRLFTNEDMAGLTQHNGSNGQPMGYPSKDNLQQQHHQAYQEVYGAAEGNPFIAQPGYTHLAQPFEYQNTLQNHPGQANPMYQYNAYGIADGGLVLDADYGNTAW